MRSGSAARQVAGSLTSTGGRSAPTNNFARPCADAARPARPPAQRSLSALACLEPARPSGRDARPRPALERRVQSTSASRAPTASTSSGLLHEAPSIPAPRHIAPERLALIYATLVPPPLATLHALAARIPHANLAGHVELVEQCCVCPSLWDAVAEIGQPPASFGRTGGAVSGYTHFCDPQRLDNTELATLGSTLLGLFATEWLECRYPHLPTGVLASAVTAFVGPETCADTARSWGVYAGATTSPPTAPQSGPRRGVGEAWRTGSGPLRWARVKSDPGAEQSQFQLAMSSVARALVGAVYQLHGFGAAREFVHAHFMSRTVNISSFIKFRQPLYVLAQTLERYGLEKATFRLLKESGRDTSLPIFVIGAFSGSRKLGEGFGSSLDMARFRAAEDALRRVYLSRSFADAAVSAASGSATATSDLPSLPSDPLADPAGPPYVPRPLGDEEVVAGSSGRSGWTARQANASPFRTDEPMWKRPKAVGPRPQASVRSRSMSRS